MTKQESSRLKAYGMEALGLGGFVIGASLLSILLEHPDGPAMNSFLKHYPLVRRIPLGIIMGAYVMGISLLFGKKSGAFINPAVTWTFFRLGHISGKDAVLYTIAQFAGAAVAAQLLKLIFFKWFSHPLINYSITKPIPPHSSLGAFVAEFLISFITMWTIMTFSSSKKREKLLPLMMGLWLGLFLIVELPFSGMSMNPARSFAGALAGNKWEHLWIYFVAPVLAMLLAGEIFIARKKKKQRQEILHPEKADLQQMKDYPAVS